MKNLLSLLLVTTLLWMAACTPGNETNPVGIWKNPYYDLSAPQVMQIAGGSLTSAEGAYNGATISDISIENSNLYFEAVSGTKVNMNLSLHYGDQDEHFEISAMDIPVTEHGNVISFDATVIGQVINSGSGGTTDKIHISGNATCVKLSEYEFRFDTELNLDCEWLESSTLTLSIGMHSRDYYKPHAGTLPDEATLVRSIEFGGWYHSITATSGTLDGVALPAVSSFGDNMLCIDGVRGSDSDAAVNCMTEWGENRFSIRIPHITLSGEPYRTVIENSVAETEMWVSNGIEDARYLTSITVSGYINADGVHVSSDFVIPYYDLDIRLICRWTDNSNVGHTLDFHIEGIDSFSMILVD